MSWLLDQASRIAMLALMVWREARHESFESKLAVAYVAVTRADKPGKTWWGDTLLEVLFHPMQFTSLTYSKDAQLTWWPRESVEWTDCLRAALHALWKLSPNPAPGAVYYYSPPLKQVPAAWGNVEHVADIGVLHFFKER